MPFRFICGGCDAVILEVDDIKRSRDGRNLPVEIHDVIDLDKSPFCGHTFQFYPPRKIEIKPWNNT